MKTKYQLDLRAWFQRWKGYWNDFEQSSIVESAVLTQTANKVPLQYDLKTG